MNDNQQSVKQVKKLLHLPDFDSKFESWLAGCQAIVNAKRGEYTEKVILVPDEGRRYIRIWSQSADGGHKSAYAFIDKTNGDVLKPATWKAPAAHARGNIFDAENGLGKMTDYGPEYLR